MHIAHNLAALQLVHVPEPLSCAQTGKQLSPQLLDDTMAAVVTSHLGSSPMGVPDWAHDVMSQQPTGATSAAYGGWWVESKSMNKLPALPC
jgi:hypothetical protein